MQSRRVLARWSLVLALVAPALIDAQEPPPAPPAPPAASTPTTPSAPPAPPAPPAPADFPITQAEGFALGRRVAQHAYAQAIDSLIAFADPVTGEPAALRTRLETGLKQMDEQLGPEMKVVSEKVMRVNGGLQYWRTAEYFQVPVPIVFRVVLGPNNTWRGFTASTVEALPVGEEILP